MALSVIQVKEVRVLMQVLEGAIPSTPLWFTIPAASCSVKASEGLVSIDTLQNGVEPLGSFLSGIEDVAGNISFNMTHELMKFLSETVIGAGTDSTLATSSWETATVYPVGAVITGTTPSTDTLFVSEVVGTGTSGTTAPDTTAILDNGTIEDGEIIWIVRKGIVKKTIAGIDGCLPIFAIEVVIESNCGDEIFYFRKLDCKIGTMGLNFAKDSSMVKADLSVMGAVSEQSINKKTGLVDTSYEDFATITGNTKVEFAQTYLKQSDLDFKLNGSLSESVQTMSLTFDASMETKNMLSKNAAGKNTKKIYSGRRKVDGSLTAFFDKALFSKMDGETKNTIEVFFDKGNGDYVRWYLPAVKFSKDEPEFGQGILELSPAWSAETGGADNSALQYEVHSIAPAYK